MLNKFIGIGRWTKDCELRYSQSGKEIANGTLAINDRFNKENTTFLNVVIFGKQALNVAEYTKKGSQVAVEGRIQTRSYENKEGKRVYVTEVVTDSVQFLDTKNSNEGNKSTNQSNTQNQANNNESDPFTNNGQPIDLNDDDLPF